MKYFLAILFLGEILSFSYGMYIKSENSSEIAISVYASGLTGCGLITKCDTSVDILCQSISSDWKVCEKTKKIRNNNDPIFPEVFTFQHEPGTRQRWRLDLMEHKLLGRSRIGSGTVALDEFVESGETLLQFNMLNDRGTLYLRREK